MVFRCRFSPSIVDQNRMTMMTLRPSHVILLTVTPMLLMNLWMMNVLSPSERLVVVSSSPSSDRPATATACTTATTLRSLSSSPTTRHSNTIDFLPFTAPPELHNRTVSGDPLPGLFYNDRLYLLGARLTTSYSPLDESVHVTLFGFPGDWFTRVNSHDPDAPACNNKNNTRYDRILSYGDMKKHVKLYCAIQCQNGELCNGTTDASEQSSPFIPMELIPMNSGDINQEDVTLIWHCPVTSTVHKSDLQKAVRTNPHRAVRVTFFMEERLIVRQSPYFVPVLSTDIPLSTAVVGHAGPQHYDSGGGYFTQSTNQTVGLCVDIYGVDVHKYLPEFIQHHVNVGMDQIVLGVETTMGSEEFAQIQSLLQPYLRDNVVVLQTTQVSNEDEFTCYFDFHKLHFYHQCLYHFKGLAKYSATWDVDEFWVPPVELDVAGKTSASHDHQGFVGRRRLQSSNNTTAGNERPNSVIAKSDPSRFSPLATRDPLWKSSPYASSISIRDVMETINRYHSHKGCEATWCYHLFPSYVVHLLKQMTENDGAYRTNRQVTDFLKREPETFEKWHKGVANTQVAMMSGIHLPGSCRDPSDDVYRMFAKDEKCLPHRFEPDVFGGMHHFLSLVVERDDFLVSNKRSLPKDEYVAIYAETVSQQLDRLYGKRGVGARVGTTST